MTSAVNTAFPADNVKVSKATFRAQMLIIANEITALQARTSVAGAKAFYNFITPEEADRKIRELHERLGSSYASDLAYGRISL